MGTTTVDIKEIKWLREKTGAGIMEARKALQDADGDRDKAKLLLEQRGAAKAAGRAGRETSQGLVESYIHAGGQIGVLVEVNSETDFVARTPEFKQLAREIAMQIAATSPQYVSIDEIPADEADRMKAVFRDEAIRAGREKFADKVADGQFQKLAKERALLEQPYIRDDKRTIKQLVHELSAKTGENIVIRRFARFQTGA
jgi:elongation factor Ts